MTIRGRSFPAASSPPPFHRPVAARRNGREIGEREVLLYYQGEFLIAEKPCADCNSMEQRPAEHAAHFGIGNGMPFSFCEIEQKQLKPAGTDLPPGSAVAFAGTREFKSGNARASIWDCRDWPRKIIAAAAKARAFAKIGTAADIEFLRPFL
ncbi:MAG: hypothetical protein OXI01_22070 [Albidovulum sp.]|nr:hypothetical protein [Albidovulum sp.]